METRKLEVVRNKCGFMEGICVDNVGHSEGIGLWWKDLDVHLISFSNHHILVEVKEERAGFSSWCACGVYGWADRANKYKTWDLIRGLFGMLRDLL